MSDDFWKQLLREVRLIRIGTLVIAAVLVLAALNRVFRFFP